MAKLNQLVVHCNSNVFENKTLYQDCDFSCNTSPWSSACL